MSHHTFPVFFFLNLALLYKQPKFCWTWLKQDFKAHSLLNISLLSIIIIIIIIKH